MVDMKVVKERFEYLTTQNNGRLTPDIVVSDAQNQNSPLHTQAGFEWDVNKAAQQQWVQHARELIRAVKVKIVTETVTIKSVGYVRDPDAESDEQGYIPVVTLVNNTDLARRALNNEIERALAYVKRAQDLAEAFGLADRLENIYTELSTLNNTVATAIHQPEATQPSVQ